MSSWLSSFLEVDGLDLIVFDEKSTPVKCQDLEESTETRENDVVIYQDFSPFMLIGENSLDELNKRLENKVTMKRFRPNFISKNNSAFSEVIFKIFFLIKKNTMLFKFRMIGKNLKLGNQSFVALNIALGN